MPDLTPKQEAFARSYMQTGNASAAYRMAYDAENMKDAVIHVKACELLKNDKVAVRLEELRERAQKRHDITVDKLTGMAMDAYYLAMKDSVESPSAAVSAVQVLGKLHGLIIDKSKNEHAGPNGTPLVPVVNVSLSPTRSNPSSETGSGS